MKILHTKLKKILLFGFLGVISFAAFFFFVEINTSSVKAYTCPCTIWPNTATPTTPDANDANAVELGVKFTADVDGTIPGGTKAGRSGRAMCDGGFRLLGLPRKQPSKRAQRSAFARPGGDGAR